MDIKYNEIQRVAYDVLKQYGGDIPIDLFSIIDKIKNLSISTYEDYAYILGISERQLINRFKSDEGFLLCISSLDEEFREYVLCYNQKKTLERIRWTIGHEVGHFFLNHNVRTNKNLLSRYTLGKGKTDFFEKEANHFAKHLLTPFPLVLTLKKKLSGFNRNAISSVFKINYEPAGYIYTNITRLGNKSSIYEDVALVTKFRKGLYKIIYEHYCYSCSSLFYGKHSQYCPICGRKDFSNAKNTRYEVYLNFKEEGMTYKKIEVDGNSKAVVCPVCENDNISVGDYCQICGSFVINKCVNGDPNQSFNGILCGKNLSGDARFCTYCGAESTFLKHKYLKTYDEELNEPPF